MNKEEALNYFFIIWVIGALIIYLLTYGLGLVLGSILAMPVILFATSLIVEKK